MLFVIGQSNHVNTDGEGETKLPVRGRVNNKKRKKKKKGGGARKEEGCEREKGNDRKGGEREASTA